MWRLVFRNTHPHTCMLPLSFMLNNLFRLLLLSFLVPFFIPSLSDSALHHFPSPFFPCRAVAHSGQNPEQLLNLWNINQCCRGDKTRLPLFILAVLFLLPLLPVADDESQRSAFVCDQVCLRRGPGFLVRVAGLDFWPRFPVWDPNQGTSSGLLVKVSGLGTQFGFLVWIPVPSMGTWSGNMVLVPGLGSSKG